MYSHRNPFLISIFILAMNILLEINIEVEMDHICGHICIYICIHECMYFCKEKYICKIWAPKVSAVECPVTKCNIKISILEGKRSVQDYEASPCDATLESSSHIYLVLPECQRDYDLSKIHKF